MVAYLGTGVDWRNRRLPRGGAHEDGAHEWNRTINLLLTKEVLYRLSYVSVLDLVVLPAFRPPPRGAMERETGIEPAPSAWRAEVLPLNYSRAARWNSGGGRWIRTTEGVSQQIYSLPPLAAWVSLQRFR